MKGFSRPVMVVTVLVLLIAGAAGSAPAFLSEDGITVTAQFEDAAGLYVGNPVDVLGMRIGKIKKVEQKGTFAKVTLSIDSSVKIPADAVAVTVSDSVLTDRHVEFTPPYKGGPAMRDGATLDLQHTKTPVSFDSLLAMADKLSTSLGGDQKGAGPIANMVDTGAAITSGNGQDIKSALDELSKALRMGDDYGVQTRNAITTIVKNLDSLSTAAAQNDQKIRDFASGVHQMSDLLADQNLGSGDTGAKITQILEQTTDLLQKYRGKLSGTASNADVLVKTLNDYRAQIGEFLNLFPLVVNNAYNAIDKEAKVGRVHVDLTKVVLDGQMLKEVCNRLDLKQLGCNTGKLSDMGPDFGVTAMLAGIAGLPK